MRKIRLPSNLEAVRINSTEWDLMGYTHRGATSNILQVNSCIHTCIKTHVRICVYLIQIHEHSIELIHWRKSAYILTVDCNRNDLFNNTHICMYIQYMNCVRRRVNTCKKESLESKKKVFRLHLNQLQWIKLSCRNSGGCVMVNGIEWSNYRKFVIAITPLTWTSADCPWPPVAPGAD